jgi:F-type H+-transporting ATPase subunit b
MPQLNFADYPPQLFWLAVTFIVLYFIMARVAIPRISQVLEERQNRIAHDLDEAERLRAESERAKAQYEEALNEARSKAHAMVAELRAEISRDDEKRKAELEEKLSRQLKSAEDRIGKAKKDALANVETIAGEVAASTVERLLGKSVSDKLVNDAVSRQVKEIH